MNSKPELDPNKVLETFNQLCLQQQKGYIQLAQNLSESTTSNSVDNECFVSLPSSHIDPSRSLQYHQDHAEPREAGDGCLSSDDDGQPNPLLPSSRPGAPTPRPRQLKPKGANNNNSSSSRNAAESELAAEVRATSSQRDRECKPGSLSEYIPPLSLSKGNAGSSSRNAAESELAAEVRATSSQRDRECKPGSLSEYIPPLSLSKGNAGSSSRNAAESELAAEVRATSSQRDRECKPGSLSEYMPPLSLSKGNAAGGNQDGAENKALSMLTPTSGPNSSGLSLDLHSLGSNTSRESSMHYLDNTLKVSNTITSSGNFPSVSAPQKSSASLGEFQANGHLQWLPVVQPAMYSAHSTDDESELSDSIDFLDENRKELDTINIRLVPVSKPRIRELFTSPTVYKMSSPIRGRALIINNKNFGLRMSVRRGSEIDTKNIKNVLRRLSFDFEQVHTDLSSEKMLEVIEEETKHPDHTCFGMFVLVIMSHGKEGHIFGADGVAVNLSKVYDLVSPYKFKAMAGKPKWVILQACSGERMDVESDYVPDNCGAAPSANVQSPSSPPSPSMPPQQYTADAPQHSDHLATDDLFVTRASFHSYVSMRHVLNGSWFIRALVEALYKHSCHRDIETLFRDQVMKKVRTKSLAKRNAYLGGVSGQQPTMESFPTKGRKLYLFPEFDPS